MQFAQLYDRVEPRAAATRRIDASGLLGTWVNSNPETSGIARMLLSESGGQLSLRVFAVGPEGLVDWGAAGVKAYGPGPRRTWPRASRASTTSASQRRGSKR